MTLAEFCMNGAELRSAAFSAPQPLDFVVSGNNMVVIALSGWWRQAWWEDGGVGMYVAPPPDQVGEVWHIRAGCNPTIDDLSDDDLWMKIQRRRYDMDINRAEYLKQLKSAIDWYPQADFSPWLNLVNSRPTRDSLAEEKIDSSSLRPVARLFLENEDNAPIDVLVFDGSGRAASANGTVWLEQIADEWRNWNERPDLSVYFNWLIHRQPYGAFHVGKADLSEKSGTVQEIASSDMLPA